MTLVTGLEQFLREKQADLRLKCPENSLKTVAGSGLKHNWATTGLQNKEKSPETQLFQGFSSAQMERFELSHRLSQSTPLAGEPLEPLGYICRSSPCFLRDLAVCLRLRLRTRATGEMWLSPAMRLRQSWRRERDSNPRCLSTSLVFKTSALNRSAIAAQNK